MHSEIIAVRAAIAGHEPGIAHLRAGGLATARGAPRTRCDHRLALAQLLHWGPVPGFEPSPQTFAPSVEDMRQVREEFGEAVRRRELAPRADSDDAVRLYTVVLSGVISQQLANQPGVPFSEGAFTRLDK